MIPRRFRIVIPYIYATILLLLFTYVIIRYRYIQKISFDNSYNIITKFNIRKLGFELENISKNENTTSIKVEEKVTEEVVNDNKEENLDKVVNEAKKSETDKSIDEILKKELENANKKIENPKN